MNELLDAQFATRGLRGKEKTEEKLLKSYKGNETVYEQTCTSLNGPRKEQAFISVTRKVFSRSLALINFNSVSQLSTNDDFASLNKRLSHPTCPHVNRRPKTHYLNHGASHDSDEELLNLQMRKIW